MQEQPVETTDMAKDERPHLLMRTNSPLVHSDDLSSTRVSSPEGPDVYKVFDEVEEWRQSKDILYRLLTADDPTELHEHVLGIIARDNTTLSPGLLNQQYGESLSPRAWGVFARLQFIDEWPALRDTKGVSRTMAHFILLVALCVENEFCQYIVSKSHDRDRLRRFVNEVMQPMLGSLFRGQVMNPNFIGSVGSAFGLAEFVDKARAMYGMHCTPIPVNGPIPLKSLRSNQY